MAEQLKEVRNGYNEDIFLPCQVCQGPSNGYQKCISEGMSKTRIKVGRHSKKTNAEKLKRISNIKSKCSAELLPVYSDADDIISSCFSILNNILQSNWTRKIDKFDEQIKYLNLLSNKTFVSMDDFIDIHQVTGIEMDDRAEFTGKHCEIFELGVQNYLPLLKGLPGLREISDKDFIKLLCYHEYDFCLVNLIAPVYRNSNGIEIFLGNGSVKLSRETLKLWLGNNLVDKRIEAINRKDEMNLNREELLLIFAMSLSMPVKDFKYSPQTYNRFVMALTRYLQRIYGDSYHLKLADYINFLSFLSEKRLIYNKWRECYKDYFSWVYKTPMFRIIYGGLSNEIDEKMELISDILHNKSY
ncbi:DgyrCDS10208 [Dimorphilus gyrociliatus]|uniref:DgyrCDS10208 n=1 Tax=Dimorphilus gyrociliatus TaxID=2664684 RepID=A0A7I8VZR5_9ANNE|nr:DgyrCDS10208 [Dimorphilus gyrociliatus]